MLEFQNKSDNELWVDEYFNFGEPINIGNDINNNSINSNNDNYDNYNSSDFSQKNPYLDIYGQNNDEIIHMDTINKSNNNDWIYNPSFLNENKNNDLNPLNHNKNFEINQNRSTNPKTETILGKTIYTSTYLIEKKCNELGVRKVPNYDNIKQMEFLKNKRKRRTQKEIENYKKHEDPPKPKVKNKGRHKKNQIYNFENEIPKHNKFGNDNIPKKINSWCFKSTYNWINDSFLDSNGRFITSNKKRKKNNENNIFKINPKIMTNNVRRKDTLENIEKPLKEILSSQLSSKYTSMPDNKNKILIEKILQENNQDFVNYILNMRFIDVLNYYNGIITDEIIINHFKEKYDEKLIRQFINNFKKIDYLLEHLAKEEKNETIRDDYIERVKIFCLNYKQSFELKRKRGENKKKKNDNNK